MDVDHYKYCRCFVFLEKKEKQNRQSKGIGGSAIDSKKNTGKESDRQQENGITEYLEQLKFKKRLFGVDEADVWKKIQELHHLYEEALAWERKRYDLLLQERTRGREERSDV